ncbi:non-specific lipid transfer protein GPI-anchored 30-like [Apium graveolens]|uniref:non-specific lipid transfer protein GPI-anchored 30-like n=1 Tax=Apium graveolens TaxID=4045 RepID=UPI003D794FB8
MALMVFISAQAEQEDRSCINKLVPCLNYLNGTGNPPDDCCDPLKSVIKSNPECVCSLITNQVAKQAKEAGIDFNEAQQLPARCGQRVNPISCLTDSGGSSSGSKKRNERMVLMLATYIYTLLSII